MSHDHSRRAACVTEHHVVIPRDESTRRDGCGRWLWRLVGTTHTWPAARDEMRGLHTRKARGFFTSLGLQPATISDVRDRHDESEMNAARFELRPIRQGNFAE